MLLRTIILQTIVFIIYCTGNCSCNCIYDGESFEEGERWNASCDICICSSSSVSCSKSACPAISCKPGEFISHTPTECCPQCQPHKRPCNDNSTNHLHNEVWPSDSKCVFYHCQDGISVPFIIQCPSLVCLKGETQFSAPGECCPKCLSSKCVQNINEGRTSAVSNRECFHLFNTSMPSHCDKKINIKKDFTVFWKDPCTFCATEESDVNCYTQSCSSCSSHNNIFLNDSCCSCSQKDCDKGCLKCLDSDSSYCMYCEDPINVIYKGKCIEKCPESYFVNDNMHCQSCPNSCNTCFGNMTSQCSSCNYGLLLQKGHCVHRCSQNFYEYLGHCYDCHESCSSCVGASENDCVACGLSGQLLQDGRCVDDCEGHFYVSDGYCLACNESCVRCLKNGSCQFCEPGFYLEEGFCLPECSPGYYTFLDAYCLVCHQECQECFGPLPYQCTSCPFNQYLLKNSCVWDCGQGYFGDLGAGVCKPCHSKCRTCLGGTSDDRCLSCSSGYLLPYIGTLFGPCIEKCPEQYYLMESGICGMCFETCETCFGPNDTECTSCNNTLHFKNGACVPHCSAGNFQKGGICYACHPSCATCHGFIENDCYMCPYGRQLTYGKCISICEEGKYMKLDGSCYDCHPSCADCLLSSGEVQCIKCKNQQQKILKDQCVESCSSNFYLNSYHMCKECHSTCATCERSGATNCASCQDNNFLTHLGTCEPHCHKGYYPLNGFCEPCSSNCYSCTDAAHCLHCKGDLVLLFGYCKSECPEQYYMNTVNRQCKECSSDCFECRGSSSSDCTSCVPGKLFEDGACVNECSEGFFEDGSLCETCDLKCQACSTLNKCTSCELPFLLLKNECVDDCGAGYYADYETLNCKVCNSGCVSCVSSGECGLCSTGHYLLNFECLVQCPHDYYPDPLLRICKKNTDVPSLNTNSILSFQPERRVLISASFISASDADSDFLLIMISQLPQNGFLLKMSETGEEIPLSAGGNFTSTHLKDGWIFFKHLKGIPLEGDVTLKVSDGHLLGNEINLPLHISSVFSPSLEQIRDIVLIEGSMIILNSSYLSIQDPDNLKDVTLQVLQGPCSGKLVLLPDEKEVLSISYEDFLKSRFALKTFQNNVEHDDRFVLRVSDGYNSVITVVQVFILPQVNKELFILRNKPLLVKYNKLVKLTSDQLLVVGQGLLPYETIFTVEKSAISAFGYLYKNVNNSKHKINKEKIIFTQEDINQGIIYYKHLDNSTSSLSLLMKVKNAKLKTALNVNFEIQVFKQEDFLVLNKVAKQFGMMVLQNHPATITNDHLQMQLNSVPSSDIVYLITKKLLKEEGFLESLDKPGYRLQSFTQNDIDNMKIVYHPPPYTDASETHYVFQFVVLDSKRGMQLSPVQNFTITIRPHSTEFTSPSSSVDNEVTILVPQGQMVELGSNWLSTVGHEIPDDQLEVVLTTAPQHGKLFQKQNDIEIELDDGFSFTSIINDAYYIHDGSDKFKDYAMFKIMGGPYSSMNKVNFNISPNDRESPVILDSTTLTGSVTEGEYLNLYRRHLAFTDLVSSDDDIMFTLINEPKYGKLEKKRNDNYVSIKNRDTFTQQDINDQFIRYVANAGFGDKIVRDFLYFDVSDGSGNVQSNQVLTMKVKPKIREPPVMKVLRDVKVNESGEAVIEPNVITVFDPDSPLSNLTVHIKEQPTYGILENSRPIPGAESSLGGLPIISFPYIDLVEGYIKYIQFQHRGMEPERDTVYIYINDGYSSSPTHLLNITIKPINDEIPHVFTQNLSVLQGGYAKIQNLSLAIIDEDTSPDQLLISLTHPPQKGRVRLMESNNYNFKSSKLLSKEDIFSFQDILNGLLMYVHEDSKSHENDSFSFSVNDGYHTISSSLYITIIVKDREVPYLLRNLGLELMPGETRVIDNRTLNGYDSDSFVKLLKYVVTSDPSSGQLFLMLNGIPEMLSSDPRITTANYFTQDDIDDGKVEYHHNIGAPIGLHHFTFNIKDPANNTLLNQKFFISISEDLFPPIITQNTGLEVEEEEYACINSSMLAAVDEHQKDRDLIFSLSSFPLHGFLEMKDDSGKSISSFLMSDLKAGHVCYVHKSDTFTRGDGFSFTVSDGKNYILQTFMINITSEHSGLPFIKVHPLLIQEGSHKLISEFEIDVFDRDTSDTNLIITVTSPPSHGTLIQASRTPINELSVDDIKHGRISYLHDDSDTTYDSFAFVISDGSNEKFIFTGEDEKNITTANPIVFPIKIFPVDDSIPYLLRNRGFQVLKKDSEKVWNNISKNILLFEDADTNSENILYRITLQPRYGFLHVASKPNEKIIQFTQDDINKGDLQYILKIDDFKSIEDRFIFSVEDTKPNKIFNNIFNIKWARIHFNLSSYNVSESNSLLELSIIRTGNKNLDFTAFCKVEKLVSYQRTDDSLIAVVDEVHFKQNEDVKFCIFKIIDNAVFEGRKEFKVILQSEVALMGSPNATNIFIFDEEDEPVISLKESTFRINETNEYYSFPVVRKGDLKQELSVLCETSDITAVGSNTSVLQSGSDYRSRDSSYHSFITFSPGISEIMCNVKIIDDNLFEEEEEFYLILSNPHPVGKIENHFKARVIIEGPNDAPYVFIQQPVHEIFVGEENSSVSIQRQGVDITKTCTVWCGSKSSSSALHKNEGYFNSYQQITFNSSETSSVDCFIRTALPELEGSNADESLTVFLDSPSGCLLGAPNKITVALKKKVIRPIIEFGVTHLTVHENAGSIQIPVFRTGDLSSSVTLHCVTEDVTAKAREDFEERYQSRKNSLIHFSPGQRESLCPITVYDDDLYEGSESFKAQLLPFDDENELVTIENKNLATVEIIDPEDVTVIEFENPHYLVAQSSFPNSSTSAIVSVIRHGDISFLSKIRISTIDGSASSGLDYYAKSKLFTFRKGERKKNFEIEILYNKRRNWALSFTVILGPDEVLNAEIGNRSKAVITIPRVYSTESLILPAVPVVVSLIHYNDVSKGMKLDAKSGYPLVCVTPCDINYPEYGLISGLCTESGITAASVSYTWEIAMPLNSEEIMSPYEKVVDSTLFTSAYVKVLDSIYFRPHEKVRCIAQPKDSKGHLGIPLRSKPIKISPESGFCVTPNKMPYSPSSLSSQPFIATLDYINSTDIYHPNKLHIHIEIPHEDGLLPLISTYPLHNIEFLLTQDIYRQQHVCSNLLQNIPSAKSFLKNFDPHLMNIKEAFPYYPEQSTKEMKLIYQHLDLKKCKWSFDAWYSMSDLVELCGGTVTSDFKARDTDRTYISILLPFYVTYIFAAAPTGWTSVEHRTEIEFSFFYNTFLWKSGSHIDDALKASLSIVRIATDSSGHLFFEFKTIAKFYGCFVVEHHTLPGIKSHLSVPSGLDVKFNLELLWSEQTFDGPTQFWKATSNYNLKDYSGHYTVHLIPCEVAHTEQFSMHRGHQFLPCIVQAPQKFDLPITFQQTLRPEPVTYALETFFQLFNDESLFLLNPFENLPNFQYIEYKGAFSRGDNVYGRVFWSPAQALESAYQLKVNEVLLCTGKNGHVPIYDPTGTVYGKGPQYGCLIPNKNLRHKFILLNRHNPDTTNAAYQGLSFNTEFIEDSIEYAKLSQVPGVDGFVFNTDPLYEVSSSHQWFLQVTYSIKPTHNFRNRRSTEDNEYAQSKEENRTNIKMIFLKIDNNQKTDQQALQEETENQVEFGIHHFMYIVSIMLILLGIAILRYKKPQSTKHKSTKVFDKYYTWMSLSKNSRKCYEVQCKQKIKQTERCKIKVYTPKNEIEDFTGNSSETEV